MKYLKILVLLSLAGLAFSGYLSAIKIFSGVCAFNESCPYFLGYPACWYGFAMYFLMTLFTILGLVGKFSVKKTVIVDLIVSVAGLLFAGNFVIQEILASKITGSLGFSTCVYGLIFYIAIFITSIISLNKLNEKF